MPIITRINTNRSPLLCDAQGYDSDLREWVSAAEATIFPSEEDAIECIEQHNLLDVKIWSDPRLEDLPSS